MAEIAEPYSNHKMMKITIIRKMFKETCFLVLFTILSSLTYNSMTVSGLPLIGNWNNTGSTVSSGSKDSVVRSDLEIRNIDHVYDLFQKGTLFIDARSPELYEAGHIRGAVSFPRNDVEMLLEQFLADVDPESTMIVYCSGIDCEDSHFVADFLIQFQLNHVRVFPGGYGTWKEKGYPIE